MIWPPVGPRSWPNSATWCAGSTASRTWPSGVTSGTRSARCRPTEAGWLSATGREGWLAAQQAEAVDGGEAGRAVDQRVDVEGVDPVPARRGQGARADQEGGQGVAVPGALATQSVQHSEVVELGDQLGGVGGHQRS